MMLAQPAPEANLNAGEQYSVMQLLRREPPAVLYKAGFSVLIPCSL